MFSLFKDEDDDGIIPDLEEEDKGGINEGIWKDGTLLLLFLFDMVRSVFYVFPDTSMCTGYRSPFPSQAEQHTMVSGKLSQTEKGSISPLASVGLPETTCRILVWNAVSQKTEFEFWRTLS